jgi:hypothetical protein
MCSFLVARIVVAAKRKRFSVLSPAPYTNSDRMICPHFPVMERLQQNPGSFSHTRGVI